MKLLFYCLLLLSLLSILRRVNGQDNDEDDVATTDEAKVVTSDADQPAEIANAIKALKPDDSLTSFINISDMIKNATGMLPKSVIPILQKLSHSYLNSTKMIKVSFADSAATLSKFVVKSYRVIQRGMNKNDKKLLTDLVQQINTDINNKLRALIESSRSEFAEIHKQLLINAHGHELLALLKDRDTLKADLLRRSEDFGNISSQYDTTQEEIKSIRHEMQIFEKAIKDPNNAREKAEKEIKNLIEQLADYEKKVLTFSWKERDVHISNGEKLARKNRSRLLERLCVLHKRVENWLNINFTSVVEEARIKMKIYEEKNRPLTPVYTQVKEGYDTAIKKIYRVDEEVKRIYKWTGTVNVNSLKMVDELARAVYSAQESIVSTYGKLRSFLIMIDADEDLLVSSVQCALRSMNIIDTYMGTTRIHHIKQVLALQ